VGALLILIVAAQSLTMGVYAPARKSAYLANQKKYLQSIYSKLSEEFDVPKDGFPRRVTLATYFEGGVSQYGDVYLGKIDNGEIVICNIMHATRYGDLSQVLRTDGSIVEGVPVTELELVAPYWRK